MCLTLLLPWQLLLQGWESIHVQQDAGELLAFLLGKALPPDIDVAWQARLQVDGATRVMDVGGPHSPLAIEVSSPTLQGCIQAWHAQHYLHAVLRASVHVPIVLQRYAGSRCGPRKQTQPLNIQAGMTVCLPVFAGIELQAQWAEYQGSVVIEHVGPSLSSGHYRTFLSGYHPLRQ